MYQVISFSQSFTVIGLPDTQSYINLGEPDDSAKWMSQVYWIRDNYIDSNIVFVSHYGDVTDGNTTTEWKFADRGFDIIESVNIPYGIAPGNHDRSYHDGAFHYENYNTYFGSDRFAERDYYIGSYGAYDQYNVQFFEAAGMEFMILHLTYSAEPPGIAWADAVLKAYPERRAIVTSHNIANYDSVLDTAVFDYSGQMIYDGLKDNPNLFLMLCGHYHDTQRATRRMDSFNGKVIHTQMANYQGLNGHIRILKFIPEKDSVYVTTYSPLYRTFLTDPDNQFAFYFDMVAEPAENDVRIPNLTGAAIEESNPSLLKLTYDLPLVEIAPPLSSFDVKVGSSTVEIKSISVAGTEVKLVLSTQIFKGETVTVSYKKPAINPLQTSAGGQAASFTARSVTNNSTPPDNKKPVISIASPTKSESFTAPALITIDADAYDPDGSIVKVEFYNGTNKLGEKNSDPYSFIWKDVPAGTYSFKAVATDNLNARTESETVQIIVQKSSETANQLPVVTLISPIHGKKYYKNDEIVIVAEAFDNDGTISNIEIKNGETTIAFLTEAPYEHIWENIDTGRYVITAIATDNRGAKSTSLPLDFMVEENPRIGLIRVYPNPNDGHFTADQLKTSDGLTRLEIFNILGQGIHSVEVNPSESIKEIDISNLPSGTYFIKHSCGNLVLASGKFIRL